MRYVSLLVMVALCFAWQPLPLQMPVLEAHWDESGNILLTTPKYMGLFRYNMEDGAIDTISTASYAGYHYNMRWGKLLFREQIDTLWRIVLYDTTTKKSTVLVESKRRLGVPAFYIRQIMFTRGDTLYTISQSSRVIDAFHRIGGEVIAPTQDGQYLFYCRGDKLIRFDMYNDRIKTLTGEDRRFFEPVAAPTASALLVKELGGELYLVDSESCKMSPLGDGNYYSFSPARTLFAFTRLTDDGERLTGGEVLYGSTAGDVHSVIFPDKLGIPRCAAIRQDGALIVVTNDGRLFVGRAK